MQNSGPPLLQHGVQVKVAVSSFLEPNQEVPQAQVFHSQAGGKFISGASTKGLSWESGSSWLTRQLENVLEQEVAWLQKRSVWSSEIKHLDGGQSESTVGRAFALHAADLGSILSIPYGLLSLPGQTSEGRVRSNS